MTDHREVLAGTESILLIDYPGRVVPDTHTDLVYSYRPIDELPGIVEEAARLGAKAVWTQYDTEPSDDERARARAIVEAAGLAHVDAPLLLDAVADR